MVLACDSCHGGVRGNFQMEVQAQYAYKQTEHSLLSDDSNNSPGKSKKAK